MYKLTTVRTLITAPMMGMIESTHLSSSVEVFGRAFISKPTISGCQYAKAVYGSHGSNCFSQSLKIWSAETLSATFLFYLPWYVGLEKAGSTSRNGLTGPPSSLTLQELGGIPDYLQEALSGQMDKCVSIATLGSLTSKSQASSDREAVTRETETFFSIWPRETTY